MVFIQKTELRENIYLLNFKNQYSLTSTFLRFQEYYESPKFRGKIFSLKEFKRWYATTKEGSFTYYTDWSGFNIPSYVLNSFFKGKFDPLSSQERKFLSLFNPSKEKFYIIGIHSHKKQALSHELAHALFYTDLDYRKQVLKILKLFNTSTFKKELLQTGYCKHVLNDEVNAYCVEGSEKFKVNLPKELKLTLQRLFNSFSK